MNAAGLFDPVTLTPGQAFGLLLLGMGLGVLAGGLCVVAWLTRVDRATRLPEHPRPRRDDEPPTERVTHQPIDLPRPKGHTR